jgi:hypothetical protein
MLEVYTKSLMVALTREETMRKIPAKITRIIIPGAKAIRKLIENRLFICPSS